MYPLLAQVIFLRLILSSFSSVTNNKYSSIARIINKNLKFLFHNPLFDNRKISISS